MAENLDKWPSKREPISKIRPSDGCGRDTLPLVVERWYDFPEFGDYLGNVGQPGSLGLKSGCRVPKLGANGIGIGETALSTHLQRFE